MQIYHWIYLTEVVDASSKWCGTSQQLLNEAASKLKLRRHVKYRLLFPETVQHQCQVKPVHDKCVSSLNRIIYMLLVVNFMITYNVFQKMRLAYSWISCAVASLLQWNLACDILMILAIKCTHNHLKLVMFLHYLTLHKNWNTTLTKWSIDTWDHIPRGIIEWQTAVCTRIKAKGHHFEHLLWSSHTTGSSDPLTCQISSFHSHSHFRATYMPNRFFSEPLTLLRVRHNFSVFV